MVKNGKEINPILDIEGIILHSLYDYKTCWVNIRGLKYLLYLDILFGP